MAIIMILVAGAAHAEVGMWIPLFIERNITQMKDMGCKLSAEDIYSINKASLKDAVVIFGGGCTGEVVSEEGLLLTNHHCGYDAIQKLSSVKHNYLADGFWAMSKDEELPCEGLEVTFLENITDVTSEVMEGTESIPADSIHLRAKKIAANIKKIIEDAASPKTYHSVEVESFYGGNQYLLFKYKTFSDIRLVGTPPDELGRFGGDTDNWVWPRHTCDFSMFRIYADKDNNPATYSTSNVPYKPARHLKISTQGIEEGDFTMVMGYPGSTNLYAPSGYIKLIQDVINPKLIEMRTAKLKVMNRHQATSQEINIQYAAKNASTSNAWKKWQGEVKGLIKTDAVENKSAIQQKLLLRNPEAESLLSKYASIYNEKYAEYKIHSTYINEIFRGGVELLQLVRTLERLNSQGGADIAGIQKTLNSFYRDYNYDLSKEMAIEVLNVYSRNIDKSNWRHLGKYDAKTQPLLEAKSIENLINDIYTRSAFRNAQTALRLLEKKGDKFIYEMRKDPIYALYRDFEITSSQLKSTYGIKIKNEELDELDRRYIKAMLEAYPDSLLPSDANFTMRVSYGNMSGYEADDAVEYSAFTTLDGVIEKNRTGNSDYAIPDKLKELYETKAYSEYADKRDGRLHTAFVATNHTTGGNSGSPVLNADGELIGLNFDRAWNGVMSDMYFNPLQCRNITLDIRYLLFIVDKYGNAKYLVDEMLDNK